LIYIKHKDFFKYFKIETRSETSKSGDRSLAIPVELPRDFWNYFKSKKSAHNTNIPLEQLKKFCYYLSNNISTSNEEADDFWATNDLSADNVCFPKLAVPFSQKEILDDVKKLKRNKANGSNYILNDYCIECIDIIVVHLCVFSSAY